MAGYTRRGHSPLRAAGAGSAGQGGGSGARPLPRAEPAQLSRTAFPQRRRPSRLGGGAAPPRGRAGGAPAQHIPDQDRRSAPPLPAPPPSGGARARGDNFPRSLCRRAAAAVPTLAVGPCARAAGRSGGTGGARLGGTGRGRVQHRQSPLFPRCPSPQEQPAAAASIIPEPLAFERLTTPGTRPLRAAAVPCQLRRVRRLLPPAGCQRSRRTQSSGPARREGWGRGEGVRREGGCWRSLAALPVSLSRSRGVFTPEPLPGRQQPANGRESECSVAGPPAPLPSLRSRRIHKLLHRRQPQRSRLYRL